MATINKLVYFEDARAAQPVTHEGAKAKRIDYVAQLERTVMSCLLWESEFYEDGVTISERIESLVAKIPPSETARIAIQAKEDMRLRHVPLLLARCLAKTQAGREELRNVLPRVITRADDISEFLALYWLKNPSAALAKQIKKHLGNSFRKFDEYQLAKYSGGQKAVKLRDAIRMLRPKPESEDQSKLWNRLVKGELATPDTWEVELSRSDDKKASWTRLIIQGKLGGLATLRNIRNMAQAGVEHDLIVGAINQVQAGRLLPINFIAAANTNPQYEPYIEAKFFECFAGKEKVRGSTIILVDVSGSMDAALSSKSELKRIDVACSLAMIGREMFEDLRVVTFSQSIIEVPARRGFALRDAVISSQYHGGTYLGAAVRATDQCDRLIVITDEQSHDPVPDRDGYMINVASNKNGIGYGVWRHIDGWSDKVLDYIVRYEASQSKESV